MTLYSLVCTKCGHTIQSADRDELIRVKRLCPNCESSCWEVIEGEPFPIKPRERELLYKKVLWCIDWCIREQACRHPGKQCPLKQYCDLGMALPEAILAWLMEAEI